MASAEREIASRQWLWDLLQLRLTAMPAARSSKNGGVELASKHGSEQAAQMMVQVQSDETFASASRRRRSTLADMRKDLEDLQKQQPRWRWRAEVALALYTLARIAAGIPFVFLNDYIDSHKLYDAVLRPLVTGFGLYVFVNRMDRFSVNNHLHVWSFVTMSSLALPVSDVSVYEVLHMSFALRVEASYLMLLWEVLCNVLQIYMTILKLRALGWHRTARCCSVLTALALCLLPLAVVAINSESPWALTCVACVGCCFAVVGIQCWALCRAASGAMVQARGDEAVWWTVCLLYANACLVPLGPALSLVGLFAFWGSWAAHSQVPLTLVTLDVSFQVFNVLLLSGMVGAIPMNLETLQKLAELSGFGLASARVAFPGHISRGAADCVVSFPGKYSDLWDKAVSSVAQEDAFSLACVFLTDAESGLGRHANNPETPGKCWCQTIYGRVPASTYLSVVDISTDESGNHDRMLAFKRADAEAMGQRLLIKQHQGDIEWEQELAEALQDAEVRCIENQDRAPWGCQWFEEWKRNVDRAAELQQTLHVFYFQDSKGRGKMHWDLLANEKARHAARKDSGLGASQTAEVAYLDKIGLSYVEHDIMEFEAFLTSQT